MDESQADSGSRLLHYASLVMCIQLSLFDLSGNVDTVSPVVSLRSSRNDSVAVRQSGEAYETIPAKKVAEPEAMQPISLYGESGRHDSIQPMGDLARLVLARYDMVARRREEILRRKAEQPRRSIRVLGPVSA